MHPLQDYTIKLIQINAFQENKDYVLEIQEKVVTDHSSKDLMSSSLKPNFVYFKKKVELLPKKILNFSFFFFHEVNKPIVVFSSSSCRRGKLGNNNNSSAYCLAKY